MRKSAVGELAPVKGASAQSAVSEDRARKVAVLKATVAKIAVLKNTEHERHLPEMRLLRGNEPEPGLLEIMSRDQG